MLKAVAVGEAVAGLLLLPDLAGDVGGDLDHLERCAVGFEDGIIGRLQPDFATVAIAAVIGARVE